MIPIGDVIPTRTRPWLTITAMATMLFSGGTILTVASNLLSLWIFGPTLEDRMGHARFVLFLILCGSLAGLAERAGAPGWPVAPAAANGAVAAVVAAYFVLFPQSKVLMIVPLGVPARIVEAPAFTFLALWFLLQSVSAAGVFASAAPSPVPGVIPSWAHLAGCALGAATVLAFRRRERQRIEWWGDRQDAVRRLPRES